MYYCNNCNQEFENYQFEEERDEAIDRVNYTMTCFNCRSDDLLLDTAICERCGTPTAEIDMQNYFCEDCQNQQEFKRYTEFARKLKLSASAPMTLKAYYYARRT